MTPIAFHALMVTMRLTRAATSCGLNSAATAEHAYTATLDLLCEILDR
jgi:hypothetical protein